MKLHPLRLPPGADLRRALEALVRDDPSLAGFVVSGIGSLDDPSLRLAYADDPCVLPGPHEVLTLAGSVSVDGAHLHAAVAGADGRVTGGHVAAGCRVRTTMEILLACTGDGVLGRAPDAATGFDELVVTPRGGAPRTIGRRGRPAPRHRATR